MKFGGTSVGSAEMVRETVGIIKGSLERQPIVVVSAVSKITDLLINTAHGGKNAEEIEKIHSDIIRELNLESSAAEKEIGEMRKTTSKFKGSKKELDTIMSLGERISAIIVSEYARTQGIDAKSYNAYDLGMLTNSNFGSAEVLDESYTLISEKISAMPKGQVPIITGFIGKNKKGEITTLGRGGSDYSASIIGAAVNAEEVQIWTDADGVMTADPRIVKNARTIDLISFSEASELAYLGAKILHPKTIFPVMKKNIPVKVLNTYNPDGKGTRISMNVENGAEEITSIAYKKKLSIININSERMFMMHGFLHKIFKIFDEQKVSVDMISTSEVNVSVTVDRKSNNNLDNVIGELEKIADIRVEGDKASISVVGRAIKRTPGISGKIFSALGSKGINIEMISQGASEINIGMVLSEEDSDTAVREIHKTFFGG
ncbi:aspartate kinase [Candidatus Woesearchaeota archaeon]|nr:aspartate kinase [Candidatus Woesearchaeota archaeon]